MPSPPASAPSSGSDKQRGKQSYSRRLPERGYPFLTAKNSAHHGVHPRIMGTGSSAALPVKLQEWRFHDCPVVSPLCLVRHSIVFVVPTQAKLRVGKFQGRQAAAAKGGRLHWESEKATLKGLSILSLIQADQSAGSWCLGFFHSLLRAQIQP